MNKLILLVLIILFFSCTRKESPLIKEKYPTITISVDSLSTLKNEFYHKGYESGYKDALEDFILLNVELEIKKEKKTFGEMEEILLERNQFK